MIGTFLASEARILCRLLETCGIDGMQLYREAGLDASLVNAPRARYPFDRVASVWARAAEQSGRPRLGLELAQFYRPTDFYGLAVVFLASPDLHKGLERIVRYYKVINTALALRLEKGPDHLDLVCAPVSGENDLVAVVQDARAAIIVDLCRTAASGVLDPRKVEFTYPRPADTSEHTAMFRCPVAFGARQWRISFHRADLDRPFLAENRDLARANDRVLDEMVRDLRQDDLVSRVKLAMVEDLPSGTPSEEAIAKDVAMSTRSLQRRLREEGTSFSALLTAVRRELAERYVRERRLPVTEISYMLGFSDVSSFSRAFKRWTGRSPAALRRAPA